MKKTKKEKTKIELENGLSWLLSFDFYFLGLFDDLADQQKEGIYPDRKIVLLTVEKYIQRQYNLDIKYLYYNQYRKQNFKKCFENQSPTFINLKKKIHNVTVHRNDLKTMQELGYKIVK